MKRRPLVFLMLLSLISATPTTQPDIPKLITSLSSSSYHQRQSAAAQLSRLYFDYAPQIQSAFNQPNQDPETHTQLAVIIHLQQPRLDSYERKRKILEDSDQKCCAEALDDYNRIGKHDPSWDAAVREFFTAYHAPALKNESTTDRQLRLLTLANKLRDLHCDDPLAMYLVTRCRQRNPTIDAVSCLPDLKAAANALESSDYSPWRKAFAHARYAQFVLESGQANNMKNWRAQLEPHLNLAMKHWPAAVHEPLATNYNLSDLANVLVYDWHWLKNDKTHPYGDRAQVCEKLLTPWQEAQPNSAGTYYFKGSLYVDYAWDARGSGFANTVTSENSKKMDDRLTIARASLEKAYELDPTDPRAPTKMLNVELGQSHGQVDLWWQRAMTADPDNLQACAAKLYYLEPKWYGSPAQMLTFGHECLAAANFPGRIPFILVHAHQALSKYLPDPDVYFKDPQVWTDLRSVYEPYLALFPNSIPDRSQYAHYACLCEQYPEANRQFTLLGDHPDLTPFGSQEVYDLLRHKAQTEIQKSN